MHSTRRRTMVKVCVTALVAFISCMGPRAALAASGRQARGPVPAYPDQIVTGLGPFGTDNTHNPMASGRVQDIEQDPFNPAHELALSDTALWSSTDRGHHWHLEPQINTLGQSEFKVATIAFDPLVRGVVLLASTDDLRTPTNRGIYRSTDGGRTWSRPLGYQPVCSDASIGYLTTVTFHGHDAYAAGWCVVGASHDDGRSWSWSAPDTGGWFGGVTIDRNGTPFACGNNGVFELGSSGWQVVVDFLHDPLWVLGSPAGDSVGPAPGSPGNAYSTCRIIASPAQPEHIFFTARWQGMPLGTFGPGSAVLEARKTQQGTWAWQDLKGGSHPNGRDVVLETRPVPGTPTQTAYDLYWNSTDAWYFQRCSLGLGFECTPGRSNDENVTPNPPWTVLPYPPLHADAGRILFSTSYPFCVELIADDGGLQRPASGCDGTGTDWEYSSVGMQALEPYDLAVTSIGGRPGATDVYTAAQDNGLYGLLAGEPGWRQQDGGNDGYHVAATPTVSPAHVSTARVYYTDGAIQFTSTRGFSGFGYALFDPFSNPASVSHGRTWPWSGLQNAQQMSSLPDGRLLLTVTPPGVASAALFVSTNGTRWTRLNGPRRNSVPGRIHGEGGVSVYGAGTPRSPVIFVRALGNLFRINGVFSSIAQLLAGRDVGLAAVSGASHVLAYACPAPRDCATPQLLVSDTGGNSWRALSTITDLVTADGFGGHYMLDDGNPGANATDGEINSIAESPVDPAVLAVGTRSTGLYDSSDAGRSWERVALTAPNLWNLEFDDHGRLYIASFGRGIFVMMPAPNTLALSRVRRSKTAQTWIVRARAFGGRPLPPLPISFTLITPSGFVALGTRRTDARGNATLRIHTPRGTGSFTLLARWSGASNRELATEALVR